MKAAKISKGIDIVGNIAILKFPKGMPSETKEKAADRILKGNRSIRTILEKTQKFKGRLRKQKTRHLAGERTKEALYRENNCLFRLNVDTCYFSPRLSGERKEVASLIKKGSVLVMFAGVGPYSIAIAKNPRVERVYSNEISKEANKYSKMNLGTNKVKDKVILLQGDIKKFANKRTMPRKFDFIVMPRPRVKGNFLKEAFALSKKGTRIFYYDFRRQDEIESLKDMIHMEAEKYGKRVKIINVKKAGEIAAYTFRIRIDFKVLN